jgi:hypothetical protein
VGEPWSLGHVSERQVSFFFAYRMLLLTIYFAHSVNSACEISRCPPWTPSAATSTQQYTFIPGLECVAHAKWSCKSRKFATSLTISDETAGGMSSSRVRFLLPFA